jgi:hypothetical protein
MNEPEYVLKNGTKVQVHDTLNPPVGMLIKEDILARRTPGVRGQVCGYVPGHGGDVYWVRHDGEEDTGSAYGWWEFELSDEEAR